MSKLEMKKCKECGKMFMPTSNKQKYCSEDHYRPCPVCGKLVFAKYLSDPARCCSGVCKSKLGKLNKSGHKVNPTMITDDSKLVPMPGAEKLADLAEEYSKEVLVDHAEADVKALDELHEAEVAAETEVIDPTDGTIRKRYTGTSIPGNWINGDEYAVRIEHVDKEYVVIATYNYSKNSPVLAQYSFTNKKKIANIFKACK